MILLGCKHVTAFILSHVGLLSLVVGYCVIGAFTFEGTFKFKEQSGMNFIPDLISIM